MTSKSDRELIEDLTGKKECLRCGRMVDEVSTITKWCLTCRVENPGERIRALTE
jgi:hypothetical protein